MVEENISQKFRLKKTYKTRNEFPNLMHFLKEIEQINGWVKSTRRFLQLQIVLNTFLF